MEDVKPSVDELTATDLVMLIVSFMLCLAAAAAGSRFGPDEWYVGLNQPALTPPNWIFAPVWTTLYGLMAVSAWLMWRELPKAGVKLALLLFLIQLALNASWSWQFFGRHAIGAALITILTLVALVVVMMFMFSKHSRMATSLLVPYLAWISFASYLNFDFWRLNG